MSSTRLKNLPREYLREKKINQDINTYEMDINKKMPNKSFLPDLGVNPGNMSNSFYHKTLSNNTCDIESNLMGINSTNLVEKKPQFQPQLNKLPFKPIINISFFIMIFASGFVSSKVILIVLG